MQGSRFEARGVPQETMYSTGAEEVDRRGRGQIAVRRRATVWVAQRNARHQGGQKEPDRVSDARAAVMARARAAKVVSRRWACFDRRARVSEEGSSRA